MIEMSISELLGAFGISGITLAIVSIVLHVYRESDSRDINNFQFSGSYRPPPATENTKPNKKAEWVLWITTITLTLITFVVVGWSFIKWGGLAIGLSLILFSFFEFLDWRSESSFKNKINE